MILYRLKCFSTRDMISRLVSKVESAGIEDFDTSVSIPRDCISITADPKKLIIYIPVEMEYSQYGIDDFIRSMIPYARTNTILDRDIYKMTVAVALSDAQLIKLIKYIISVEDFIVLLDDEN